MGSRDKSAPRLSRGMIFLATIGAAILAVIIFILSQRGETSAVNIAHDAPDPISVSVGEVRASSAFDIQEQYTGLVTARRSSSLGFEAGGRLVDIAADVGDKVRRGQTLAKLDTRSLQAQLNASLANIREAEAALKLANATVERQTILEEKGLLASQSFDEASAQAASAEARLLAAQAQAENLRVRIALSHLDAPFDGVVTRRFMDEGEIAPPGQPVLEVVEDGVLEVSVGLPLDVASRLSVGSDYPIRVEAQSFSARLRTLTGIIETNQRTMTAVFDVPEDAGISPGSVARLETQQAIEQSGMWVPVSALTESDRGLWAIYVVMKDGAHHRIEKRLVDLIHSEAERAFVRGALQDGDVFVRDGLHRLTPGMLVTPVTTSSDVRGEG